MNSKMLGSIAIVAGTAIGAGMLALPLATSILGIMPAIILLLATWGLMVFSALLMLEINLRTGVGDNLYTITGKLLGKKGQLIQSAAYLSLLFALTAAYLTGGASLVTLKAQKLFDIVLDNQVAVMLFTLVLGGFAALGVAWVDKVSRFLFSLMVILLGIVLLFLLPEVHITSVLSEQLIDSNAKDWWVAIPIVATSFGFHVCIATLVRYLDGDMVSMRKVLLIGSTIPLVCYICWLLVTLGTLGAEQVTDFNGSLSLLVSALQDLVHTPWISQCVSVFADLALITSFLGVTLSLYDFIAELNCAESSWVGRIKTWLLTFTPPVLCALFVPEGFVAVLSFAAVPIVVIFIALPIAMALRQRPQQLGGYQVAGGQVALGLAGLAGLLIVGAQLFVAL